MLGSMVHPGRVDMSCSSRPSTCTPSPATDLGVERPGVVVGEQTDPKSACGKLLLGAAPAFPKTIEKRESVGDQSTLGPFTSARA